METRVITTNPSAANVIPNTDYTSTLKEYLEVKKTSLTGEESTLRIEPNDGKVYNITFYDNTSAGFVSAVAVVTEVYNAFIKIRYIVGLDNICPCSYKDILVKFIDYKEAMVNIGYISSISEYIIDTPKKFKEVNKVALLGITSELIQSIVVRLRLYDDGGCCDITGATIVDMKVGGHYQVDYLDHNDHCMYQICGILKSITLQPEYGDETGTTGFIRKEGSDCCHHNHVVGMGDSVYDNFEDVKEVLGTEHFLSLAKDKPESIKFVFDTSTEFNSSIDTVMLTDIRNVEMMNDVETDIQDPENPDISITPLPDCYGKCCKHNGCLSCADHGVCCNYSQCEKPAPIPPICDCDSKVEAGDWVFYINEKTSTASGANEVTGEARNNITMRELLEFYGSHN